MYEGLHRRRSFMHWPRISARADRIAIRGRCLVVWRYAMLHRAVQAMIVAVSLVLIMSAFLSLWAPEIIEHAPGKPAVTLMERFAQLRSAVDASLHEHAPGLSQLVGHRRAAEIDWHLAIAGVLLIVLSRVLRPVLVSVLIAVLWPVLATGFVITLTPHRVTARCGLRRARVAMSRGPTLRAVGLERYYSRLSPARLRERGVRAIDAGLVAYPPAMLELVVGGRTRPLLACRHEDRAEAIAAAFEEACRRMRPELD